LQGGTLNEIRFPFAGIILIRWKGYDLSPKGTPKHYVNALQIYIILVTISPFFYLCRRWVALSPLHLQGRKVRTG